MTVRGRFRKAAKASIPKENNMHDAPKVDSSVASDADGDGKLDLNPEKAEMTITDLVILDHQLRDEGSSVAMLLRTLAHTSAGIRLS